MIVGGGGGGSPIVAVAAPSRKTLVALLGRHGEEPDGDGDDMWWRLVLHKAYKTNKSRHLTLLLYT